MKGLGRGVPERVHAGSPPAPGRLDGSRIRPLRLVPAVHGGSRRTIRVDDVSLTARDLGHATKGGLHISGPGAGWAWRS